MWICIAKLRLQVVEKVDVIILHCVTPVNRYDRHSAAIP